MKKFINVFAFVILNFIVLFNVIPIIAAFLAGTIVFIYVAMSPYDSGFAMLIPIVVSAGLAYWLTLPMKFIVYPIMYEKLDHSNIIFKILDKCRTNKVVAIVALLVLSLIDVVTYFYFSKVLPVNSFVDFYKKSQLIGLALCMSTLLLWFKIRKPEHNRKRLILYYIGLTIVFLIVAFIFRENIIEYF